MQCALRDLLDSRTWHLLGRFSRLHPTNNKGVYVKGEDEEEHPLFRSVSQSFTEAMRRAMRVAAEDEEGEPGPMSKTDLAENARVGRSTLSSYLAATTDGPAVNPTLDVICRLAATLGVPPAFLLLRPRDWASIATSTLAFLHALRDPEFAAMLTRLQNAESTTSPEVARAAIELGELLNTVEDSRDTRLPKEVREFRRASKASTAAIAASIPFRFDGVSKDHLPVLLTLCGIVGTMAART